MYIYIQQGFHYIFKQAQGIIKIKFNSIVMMGAYMFPAPKPEIKLQMHIILHNSKNTSRKA